MRVRARIANPGRATIRVSSDTATSVIAPEEFVQPDWRLFIDTNIFMDTHPAREGGLKALFKRCAEVIRANANPVVVPTKVVDELAKQSQRDALGLSEDRANAVKKAGNALVFLGDAEGAGLVRKDLGDVSNPYADDLFIEVFKRASHRYQMCLLTNDITLRLRVRLLAAETDRRLVAGVLSKDGLIVVESDQVLYERGSRKLERVRRHIAEGSATGKDRNEAASLGPLLDEFQQTFRVDPLVAASSCPRAERRSGPATATAMPLEGAFRMVVKMKAPDSQLEATPLPTQGDEVHFKTARDGSGTLVLGPMLGEGGEGRVFSVEGDPNSVVKVFDAEHRTWHRKEKLDLLLARTFAREGIGFPTSAITNRDGEFVGYAMPRASGKVLQATVMRPARFKTTYPNWTKADLVDVCISFLERVAYLHSLNILLGDINPKNLMVDGNKDVWIIDADSWQLEGYPCPVGTPMFTAPTVSGDYADALRTVEEELFAVATMLFMILITGQFPYARAGADGGDFAALIKEGKFAFQFRAKSDRDQPDGNWKYMWSHLPFPVKRMFWNTFHRDGARYSKRPTADEWLHVFRDYKQFFGSSDDFDPMSNDVYPTRFRAMAPDTPIYECARCGASMAGAWQKDKRTYAEPRLCLACQRNRPRCADCGKPKEHDSLKDGRCWDCNRQRAEELDPSKLCRDCHQPFITSKHAGWFTRKGLEIPKSHAKISQQCPPRPPTTKRLRPPKPPATSPKRPSSPPPPKSLWDRLFDWLNS